MFSNNLTIGKLQYTHDTQFELVINFIQNIIHLQKMSEDYGNFINKMAQNPLLVKIQARGNAYKQRAMILGLPAQVYRNIWMPFIEKKGFVNAAAHIERSLKGLVSDMLGRSEDSNTVDYVLRLVLPDIIAHKANKNAAQMLERVKLLKEKWNLTDKVVGGLLVFFQASLTEPKGQQVDKKTLNQLLSLFDTAESKIDYYYHAQETLNLAVAPTLYQLSQDRMSFEQIYQNMISCQRDCIISLLNKVNFKNRIITFGQMLSELCQIEGNEGRYSQMKKIATFFLLFYNWHHLKSEKSELKSKIVVSLIAQCLHRLMYILYDADNSVLKLFLVFLQFSSIQHYEQIKSKVSYHILALFKIKLKFQNPGFCQKLQSIWLQKFRDLKLSQAYIKQAPSFIRKNQRIQPSEKGQCQTISASYMIWSPLSRKTLSSRSKASKNRARQKHSWLRIIEQQLKRLDLEKVFLLLEGFRLFYTAEFNQSLPQIQRQATDIMRMLVAVMKQATQGLAHRFNPQQLYKVIKIELARIIAFCSFEMPFPESFFEDFGIFQLCYTDEKTINVESLVKLHLKYNYELNLKDLMAIRLIQQDIHQQSSKFNLQHLEKAFEEDCFQGRLLMLFKKDFQEGQNKNAKIFIIIGKLLAIKNANITNNLLVNYAHNMFSQENKEQITFSEKTLNFSTLINKQIVKNDCQQRVKVILNMGTIFDSFEVKRGIKSIPNSRKYFLFLRNTHHNKYFLNYYQIFKGYNYLIEAIHFLQLHYNRNPSILPSKKAKRQLLELYERLNEPFAENIKYIKKYNKLQDEKDQQKFQVQDTKFLLELATRSIDNQLGLQSCFNELFIEEFPKTGVWLYYYDNILTSLIQTIAQLQVSEQIFQKLLIFKILMGFISLKLKQSKKMGKNERQLEILVTMVQRVKDEKEQELFYKEMLKQLQLQRCFKQVQNLYLELLLKNNKSNLLTAYLREKTSNSLSQMYQKGYMKYIIRDLFQNKRYIECFSEIREYKKYSYQISPQIYEIQLESQYNIMMNFTIEDFLSFFENCTYPPQSKQVTQKHFDYYFKIFRMLFERYNFTKLAHNQVFLTHYFCFIDKNLVFTENIAYIQDIIFYLLRFVFEKFQVFGASNNYAERIVKKFKDHFNYFAPVCDYLINKISKNPVKNGIIRQLLVIVLSQYPNESIWTFCFLKNFSCGGKKQRYSAQQENEMQVISQIYSKAILLLEKNQKLNKEKVTFIDELTKAGFNKATQQKKGEQIKEKKVPQINEIKVPQIKEIKVPQGIYYVFDKQYTIHKIKSVQRLGNGKSVPLLITMQLFSDKTQNSKEVKVILKCNQECKNYRIESSTANFFYQIGLIDQETTYRIFHLSKYLVMVEYVLNCGTINSVIQSNFTEYKHLMSQVNAQFSKRAQNPKKKSENRALEIYDKFSQKITLRSSEILIKINKQIRNFRDWWTTYTNFVRTLAQWSYLGYVIGLGDRHYENILITQKAKLIHIDFQYALDIGYKLGCPQWVPFRLTKFLAEPLGILSSFGMLYGEMIEVAKRFKESQANAWKALALFVGFFQTNFTLELMNRSKFQKYEFSGTEQGIAHLIQSAQNPELLRRMFIGWRSYM